MIQLKATALGKYCIPRGKINRNFDSVSKNQIERAYDRACGVNISVQNNDLEELKRDEFNNEAKIRQEYFKRFLAEEYLKDQGIILQECCVRSIVSSHKLLLLKKDNIDRNGNFVASNNIMKYKYYVLAKLKVATYTYSPDIRFKNIDTEIRDIFDDRSKIINLPIMLQTAGYITKEDLANKVIATNHVLHEGDAAYIEGNNSNPYPNIYTDCYYVHGDDLNSDISAISIQPKYNSLFDDEDDLPF